MRGNVNKIIFLILFFLVNDKIIEKRKSGIINKIASSRIIKANTKDENASKIKRSCKEIWYFRNNRNPSKIKDNADTWLKEVPEYAKIDVERPNRNERHKEVLTE